MLGGGGKRERGAAIEWMESATHTHIYNVCVYVCVYTRNDKHMTHHQHRHAVPAVRLHLARLLLRGRLRVGEQEAAPEGAEEAGGGVLQDVERAGQQLAAVRGGVRLSLGVFGLWGGG